MRRYSYIFLISLLAVACGPTTNENESSNPEITDTGETPVEFTANPQPVPEREIETLEIGSDAPYFNLPGVDGKFHSIDDYDDAQVLAVIFTCNHCPTAQAYEDRIMRIAEDYADRSVQVVAISPNSPIGLMYNELGYTDLGDTYEDMIVRANDKKFNFPYLYDGDSHEYSMAYGPVATPHAFIFDSDRKLRYVGRLDGIEKPGEANAEDVRNAIDAILAGEEVPVKTTKTFGCSIKWAWKDEYKEKIYKEWEDAPVTLEEISAEGIQELLQNNSDKLRLINIWATWCGPCVIEYPDFVVMHRMYRGRDFEFISISADNLTAKDKALKFLEEKNSALTNYIYSGDDKYELIEAVDPEWDGALPYTVLVEPGGKVVYRVQGPMDPFELKQTIVEHPMIGRYYP